VKHDLKEVSKYIGSKFEISTLEENNGKHINQKMCVVNTAKDEKERCVKMKAIVY
jgi:hypothetical protein